MAARIWSVSFGYGPLADKINVTARSLKEAVSKADKWKKEFGASNMKGYWISAVELIAEADY